MEIGLVILCSVLLVAFLWERRKAVQVRRALKKEVDELRKTSYIAGQYCRVYMLLFY